MKELLRRLWQDESGATMVEYGLMIALIAIICIGAVQILGTRTAQTFSDAATSMQNLTQQSCTNAGGAWDATAGTCTFTP